MVDENVKDGEARDVRINAGNVALGTPGGRDKRLGRKEKSAGDLGGKGERSTTNSSSGGGGPKVDADGWVYVEHKKRR